jgi:hypothetical protein
MYFFSPQIFFAASPESNIYGGKRNCISYCKGEAYANSSIVTGRSNHVKQVEGEESNKIISG